MNNIIFLDIDGVVIPDTCFFITPHASMKRAAFSPTAIAIVKKVALEANAKIVTNTMHNVHYVENRSVVDDLIANGIPRDLFHPDMPSTLFPHDVRGRMNAIKHWMENNSAKDWIAFDDEKFTDDDRLILTDPADGILMSHYRKALNSFGVPPKGLIF